MIDKDMILTSMEETNLLLPEIDGIIGYFNSDNYKANYSNDSHFISNRVSCATLTDENLDESIKEIIEKYKAKNLDFVWCVGPLTTPENIGDKLIQSGFEKMTPSDGLYLDNLQFQNIESEKLRISEIEITENMPVVSVFSKVFEAPLESSVKYHYMLYRADKFIKQRIYSAYTDNADDPIGCAYMTYFPDKPVALLSGAAVLPEFRNQGIYKNFLQQRVNDAIEDGIELLIILANQDSSASSCKKFGFKKVCELSFFKYLF